MTCDTSSQEVKTALYIYDGAEAPADYREFSNEANAVEVTGPLADTPVFWERHLQKTESKKSKKFDWIFGVTLPVICFFADPIVFKNGLGSADLDDALLSDYRPFAYLLSFMSIMAMLAWLIWGEHLKGLAVMVSGILASGAAVSLVVGLFLLPFSFFGLIFLIGILGFTPFFTFAVFWRNARLAFLAAEPHFESRLLVRIVGITALSALVIPMLVNAVMKKNIVAHLLEVMNR
ncbi:MAG: hypothetical protein ACKVRN_11020 [Pyrinomonadaceae bacterium]